MRVLSKATIYCLRGLVYLASQKDSSNFVSIGEISDQLEISFHFLTKTFQKISKFGILESFRGPNGGIALKKPASEIILTDIVLILEGESFFDQCLLGLPGCGIEAPCPVHEFWKETKVKIRDEFDATTLAELGDKVRIERLRIFD